MPHSDLLRRRRAFTRSLARWFEVNGRDYPWRSDTARRDPYVILVSEIMLQQTQIATVLDRGYFARWMQRFPDFATLARAEERDVLQAWEGLGYYRRARNLRKLAQIVVAEHGGAFPRDVKASRALPGVGDYTAGALASFAFDAREPAVDGNIARVLARLFNDRTPVDSGAGKKRLWERAAALVAAAPSARIHNSALMELGQTLCRPGPPDCHSCPVRDFCAADDPSSLPLKTRRPKITRIVERVCFVQSRRGVLLQEETGPRRTGLWKLPALLDKTALPRILHTSAYTITRYRVTLHVHAAPNAASAAPSLHHSYVSRAALETLPMPSPYRRALEAVLRLKA